MRFRGTAILFLFAALLASWYFVFQKPRSESNRREAADRVRLAALELSGLTRVRVERAADTLSLEIQGTHWHMTAPVDDIAEPASVGRLLNAIATAEIERNLGPQESLERFGLSPPACVISVADESGEQLRLEVGNYTVDRGAVYALRSGEVLLVPTGVRRYALQPAEDYRNRRVTRFDLSVVTSFTLEAGDRSMTWQRHGTGWASVVQGDTIPGDTEEVTGVLRRLRGLRAYGFPDPASAARFFPGPRWRITINGEGSGAPVTLHAAPADSGWTYTRLEGESRYVMVDSTIHRVFEANLETLRDRRLLHFDPQLCAGIAITTPDTSMTLTRSGGAWSHPNPAFPAPDAERVATLVAGLAQLRYSEVLGPAATDPWPASATRFEVVVRDERGNILDEIRCRPHPSGGYEVTGTTLGLRARVDAEELDRLVRLLSRLRSH